MNALSASADLRDLAERWRDGRIKQAITARCLALRHEFPCLFTAGEYFPLPLEGPTADRAIVFARRDNNATAITVAARLTTCLLGSADEIKIPASAWGDTRLWLPTPGSSSYHNALTGAELVAPRAFLPLTIALAELPVALLVASTS
jgi:(1->4)-alpha-D-glucan 1-alpha-D-glucosylmutase